MGHRAVGTGTLGMLGRGVRGAVGPGRRATTVAGVLVLSTYATGLLSIVPVLEEPGYLPSLADRGSELTKGALYQLLMVPAYAGFALVLHPILKRAGATLSLGFVGFRLVACGFHLLGVATLGTLLDLGQAYDAGAADAATYEALAETVRRSRDLINHVVVIVTMGLGDLLLFALLYRARLVPAWLSLWGVAGVVLAVGASLMVVTRTVEVVGVSYLSLNAPLALHGFALAAWLIGRGLDTGRLAHGLDPAPAGAQT